MSSTDNKLAYLSEANEMASWVVINHVASMSDRPDALLYNSLSYTNLRGEYTTHNTDMFLKSLDDDVTFKLTKNSLIDRPFTKEALFGYLGNELSKKHPKNILLIKGILSPIAIDTKVDDGDILPTYIPNIEPQEINLIHKLNDWVQGFRSKYDLNAFQVSDAYFNSAYLGMLHYAISVFILNIRHLAINTPEAHSFHVDSKLESHGIPRSISRLLKEVQRRFLYKNVEYIYGFIGNNYILKYLIEEMNKQTDYVVTGYKPILHLDDEENIDIVFQPSTYFKGMTNPISLRDYVGNRETINERSLIDDIMGLENTKVGNTKNILVHSSAVPVCSTVNFNDFVFYMLLYNVSLGSYNTDTKISLTNDMKLITTIGVATTLLFSSMAIEAGLSGDIPCDISVPIVYGKPVLTNSYLSRVRVQLTNAGDLEHEVLDELILNSIEPPDINSKEEFLQWCIDRYDMLLYLTSRVYGVNNPAARNVLIGVLEDMYPPVDDIALPAAGATEETIVASYGKLNSEDITRVFKGVTSSSRDKQEEPWLEAVADVLNTLSTYSTRFDVDNIILNIDMPIYPLEVLDVEIS